MARPTKLISEVLSGRVALIDSSKAIQSACELHFYFAATRIVLLQGEHRGDAIKKIPKNLHSRVKYYVKLIEKVRRIKNDRR